MGDHALPAVAIGMALLVAAYAFVRLVRMLGSGSAPGIGGPYSRQSKPVNYWLGGPARPRGARVPWPSRG